MRVFSASGVLLLLLLTACDPCRDVTITDATSPGGKYVILKYGSDCGATTSYQTFVSVRMTKAFLGFHRNRTVFSGYFGPDQVSSRWKSADSVELHCECDRDKVLFREPEWGGVHIDYTFAGNAR